MPEDEEDDDNLPLAKISNSRTIKINPYQIKCMELQTKLDRLKTDVTAEQTKRAKLESDMQKLRKKAKRLEGMYGIPIGI